MSWNQRILIVRAVSYASLLLAIVGFSVGINIQHYALITFSFVAALVAFTVGLSANMVAELIFQWRASIVRIASLIVFVVSVFGFSLGTNFQSTVLVTISFIAALASVGMGLNANSITKFLFGRGTNNVIGRG